MKMDLSCPVELWRIDLPTEEYPACALQLYNLGAQKVVSVEVTLILLDAQGEEQTRLDYRAHDLKGESGKTFRMTVPLEKGMPIPAACDVVFEKLWYDMGTVWRRERTPRASWTSNALKPGRELDALRFLAGDTAIGFPEKQGDLWICVCGRPNHVA